MRTCISFLFLGGTILAAADAPVPKPIRPGDPAWPMAWTTYRQVTTLEADIADLKAHGVGLMEIKAKSVDEARNLLAVARRTGMKYHIDLPEITEHASMVQEAGLEPVAAVMMGGVFRGKAIDRHLFRFSAGPQSVVIEPPVYSKGLPYTRGSGGVGAPKDTERIGHYYPDMPAPLRTEVVVPLKAYDGQQHLRIIPAVVTVAEPDARLEADSVAPDLPRVSEITGRTLYRLAFDLTGLDGALLDQVGIAAYWAYPGTKQYWMFGKGNVSAHAASTREALRLMVRKRLAVWSEANGGTFPIDVVFAARYGDETFFITGHVGHPSVSLPLRDWSAPSLAAFTTAAGAIEPPRTWGFPEVYGPDAYGHWLHNLHAGCAALVGVVREEIARSAPGLLLFRNTTRGGVFSPANDHDGSGQELLARQLDAIHLDPYPVSAAGYGTNIPTDMAYCAGLARRFRLPLIPWMQAHTYGGPTGLTDVSPEQVDRMAEEQWMHGVDAVMWLGYGETFPKVRPDSWERAGAFHRRLAAGMPPKPKPTLAVLRPYRTWALASPHENGIRNPADWMLQQFLHVWAVEHRQPYDVFELPPAMDAVRQAELTTALRAYRQVVSTEPRDGAWVIGAGTMGTTLPSSQGKAIRQDLVRQLQERGWLVKP